MTLLCAVSLLVSLVALSLAWRANQPRRRPLPRLARLRRADGPRWCVRCDGSDEPTLLTDDTAAMKRYWRTLAASGATGYQLLDRGVVRARC